MVVITSNRRGVILDAVRAMYTEVARRPERRFHFPTGRAACELVGYAPGELDEVPPAALESFAGVGCPFLARVIRPGDVVLDVGSGSGTDALIASGLVGPAGRVIALDMTPAMREKLRAVVSAHGIGNVEVLEGEAERIPLPDESVDVVTSNGVLNLVPGKWRAVREIARVLRRGGHAQIADIVLGRPASDACREDAALWAECIVGATTESDYCRLFRLAGLAPVEVLTRHDYFAASTSAQTREVAELFGAMAIVLRARKPESWTPGPEEDPVDRQDGVSPSGARLLEPGAVRADRILEAGARGCGEVTPVVGRELRAMGPGEVLGVRSEVPEAALELEAWSRLAGHEFVGSVRESRLVHVHFIRKRR